MDKLYDTTFTPLGQSEASKICPKCKEMLPSTKYKMKYGNRDGIDGCIRNRCCRKCEDNNNCNIITSNINDDCNIIEIIKSVETLKKSVETLNKSVADLQTVVMSLTVKMMKLEE